MRNSFGIEKDSKISVSRTSLLGFTEELAISKEKFLSDRENRTPKSLKLSSSKFDETNSESKRRKTSVTDTHEEKVGDEIADEYDVNSSCSGPLKKFSGRTLNDWDDGKAKAKSNRNINEMRWLERQKFTPVRRLSSCADKRSENEETNERKLRLTHDKMIQKSRIYDMMKYKAMTDLKESSGSDSFNQLGDGEGVGGLIDFRGMTSRDDDYMDTIENDSDCSNSDEAEVEIIDEFGRTRMVSRREKYNREYGLRRENPTDKQIPDNLIYGSIIQHKSFNISEERHRIFEKTKIDEGASREVACHYNADWEIRNKGAGFYKFSSTDENKRGQQMNELMDIREDTLKERENKDIMKVKFKLQKKLDKRWDLIGCLKNRHRAEVQLSDP